LRAGLNKKMNDSSSDKRRSDRLWLTLPLRVEVTDGNGQPVEYPGRAINLNRHGGRIQVPRELDPNQSLALHTPVGWYGTEFRVVETLTHSEHGCECGVECLHGENKIWGIEFPPIEKDMANEARALLECRSCHTIALVPLAFLEVVTLRAINMVGLDCPKCSAVTFWQYADMRVPIQREAEGAHSDARSHSNLVASLTEFVERGHRRAYVQMPFGLRDASGQSAVVQAENLSECGFCFSTERKYTPSEIVTAAFSVAAMTQLTQLPARIVREHVVKGSPTRLYGATFAVGAGGCPGV
jgi:PilZ domain